MSRFFNLIGHKSLTVARKEAVTVKQAIKFTIQQVNFFFGFETDALQCLVVGGDDPRRGSGELMLER